jgi:hypothetical protein
MEMALDDILEGGRSYGSPVEFLEKEQNHLPEDQGYWAENTTGNKETFDSLDGLLTYLEGIEDRWGNLRDFGSVDISSEAVTRRSTDEAEYFEIEFPYTLMETDYNPNLAGRHGAVRLGYFIEKEEDPVDIPVSEPADD